MAKAPNFTGLGGYGPWPDNDLPGTEQDPSPHYIDGYRNRMPGGAHQETPSEMWLDAMVFPPRPVADSEATADSQYLRARTIGIGIGNATGTKNGPED